MLYFYDNFMFSNKHKNTLLSNVETLSRITRALELIIFEFSDLLQIYQT